MKLPIKADGAVADLFGEASVDSATPITEELKAHFARGGSVDEAVRLVAALERLVLTRARDGRRPKEHTVRATRLRTDWQPSPADVQFGLGRGLSQRELATEAEKFKNYWTAKSGASATKHDWGATWRNWILNLMERRNHGHPGYSGKVGVARRQTTGSDAVLAGMARLASRLVQDGVSGEQIGREASDGANVASRLDFDPERSR